jgi:hypothetical protein
MSLMTTCQQDDVNVLYIMSEIRDCHSSSNEELYRLNDNDMYYSGIQQMLLKKISFLHSGPKDIQI